MVRGWLITLVAIGVTLVTPPPVFAQDTRGATRAPSLAPSATTEHRVALIIGNGSYPDAPLRNPVNDARDMSAALKAAGFTVTLRENVGLKAMADSVRTFADSLRDDSVAVFYYAGHGVQVRDRNYLIPIGADIQREDEIPYGALDVNQVLDKLERANSRINIVILDACRNNPFQRRFRSVGGGLAQMDAPIGTLIAYATAPGRLAVDSDGKSRNSLYTRHLLDHIRTRDLPVELMFKRVREGVMRETKYLQTPWESSSLRGDFAFFGSPARVAEGDRRKESFEAELAFWEAVRSGSQRADYEAYLQQYPQGHFATLARARLELMTTAQVAAEKIEKPDARPPAQVASAEPVTAPDATGTAVAPSSLLSAPGNLPRDIVNEAAVPRLGDSWTYTYYDGFQQKVVSVLTYRVVSVDENGISDFLSIPGQVSFETDSWQRGFTFLPTRNRTFTPPDFSPYLLAWHDLVRGTELPNATRPLRTGDFVDMKLRVTGQEHITVPAGTFQTVVLTGEGTTTRYPSRNSLVTIWYAPAAKRFVRYTVRTGEAGALEEFARFELVEYKVQ